MLRLPGRWSLSTPLYADDPCQFVGKTSTPLWLYYADAPRQFASMFQDDTEMFVV